MPRMLIEFIGLLAILAGLISSLNAVDLMT
jgi:hypothetical protein